MITLASLAALALHPTNPIYNWPEPPREIVDFLGRRRLCRQISESADRGPGDEREWARLACSSLPAEEATWRARYNQTPDVRQWLDLDPLEFRLPSFLLFVTEGPTPGSVQHIEVSGVSYDDGSPFRVAADTRAGGGRYTSFTVSFADVPERVFRVENARFPGVDLQSLLVLYGFRASTQQLTIQLRFAYPRGYCSDQADDDRPRLIIHFNRTEYDGHYVDMTNCEMTMLPLENAVTPTN
jgi:hypothetical protein